MESTVLESNGHTPYCNRWRARHAEELAEYENTYPNYCRKCKGRGGHEYNYDPSPSGVSLSPGYMTEVEPCSYCVEQGICPLCGQHTLDEDGEKCTAEGCGWTWEGDQHIAPYFECYCWENVMGEIDPPKEEQSALDMILDDLDLDAFMSQEDEPSKYNTDDGIKAVMYLQALAGINETEDQARIGWSAMTEHEKGATMAVYAMFVDVGDKS